MKSSYFYYVISRGAITQRNLISSEVQPPLSPIWNVACVDFAKHEVYRFNPGATQLTPNGILYVNLLPHPLLNTLANYNYAYQPVSPNKFLDVGINFDWRKPFPFIARRRRIGR